MKSASCRLAASVGVSYARSKAKFDYVRRFSFLWRHSRDNECALGSSQYSSSSSSNSSSPRMLFKKACFLIKNVQSTFFTFSIFLFENSKMKRATFLMIQHCYYFDFLNTAYILVTYSSFLSYLSIRLLLGPPQLLPIGGQYQ